MSKIYVDSAIASESKTMKMQQPSYSCSGLQNIDWHLSPSISLREKRPLCEQTDSLACVRCSGWRRVVGLQHDDELRVQSLCCVVQPADERDEFPTALMFTLPSKEWPRVPAVVGRRANSRSTTFGRDQHGINRV